MALRVSIFPKQRVFLPGGFFVAKLEVANRSDLHSNSPFSILVSELTLECVALERVDRTWVALAYGADVPPTEKDSRRETREIAHSMPVQLAADFRIQPGEQRIWNIRMRLPDWLPPSFKGVAVRYSYIVMASIRFSASPAAMRLLSHHLSLEQAKKHASPMGSLLIIPTTSLPKPPRGPTAAPSEPPAEQTAVAKVAFIVLPSQRLQGDFADRRNGVANAQAVLTGEDAELQPVAYPLGAASDFAIKAQEVVICDKAPPPKQPSLPRGVSLSRSDMYNRREGESTLTNLPLHPIDAWPAIRSAHSGLTSRSSRDTEDSTASATSRAEVDAASRLSPPPATPMTASDSSALRSFNLRLGGNLLVRMALHAEGPICLGATLSGTLDFRSSQEAGAKDPSLPKCVQVVILLETEERVHERWTIGVPAQSSTSGIRQVQDEHQELTPDTLLTHFMLSIPQEAPASFSSHLVALRWILRFELTTHSQQASTGWLRGGGKGVEKLCWSLPILVKPGRV